jgi:peptidoglycan/LPS O-acetylase OafA/YrhL
MNEGTVSRTANSRLPELDGLRAIAILLVLFSHHLTTIPVEAVRQLAAAGWVGVDLFFVLSGFLIGGILLDQRAASNYYQVFYLRRFFRIVPLYALLVLPGLLVLGLGLQGYFAGHSLGDKSSVGLWLCPFFLQNIGTVLALNIPAYLGPTWSVAVEEQFYLLLPPVIRRVSRKQLLTLLTLAICFAPMLRGGLLWAFGDRAGLACYVLLPCRWDSLLLGVVAAVAYREAGFRNWLVAKIRWLRVYWWVSAAISAAILLRSDDRLNLHLAFLGYTLIDSFFACTLLLAVLNPAGRLHDWLSQPALKPIATISYGLYLLQSPTQAVVESFFRFTHIQYAPTGWGATGVAALALAATFLAAALSWKYYESRLIRLGHQTPYKTAQTE